MKRFISILLAAMMIAAVALTLTGCGKDPISVTSELKIDASFKGTRTVTVTYPLSADIDAIKDTIIEDDPSARVDGVTFAYKGVEDDGYCFELVFDFFDREDYEREVTEMIGRTASCYLSRKNTALTQGTRMTENFGTGDLIAWIVRDTDSDSSTEGMDFRYDKNTVVIGSETFTTGTTVQISEIKGSTVSSIGIRTVNDKQERFSRTFEFSIPDDQYNASKTAIEQYFSANTPAAAKDPHWEPNGSYWVYTVRFEDLSIRELRQYTAELLDTDSVSITYGDVDGTSTPLSEGLAFEESLDTFSFVGPDQGSPTLYYAYSLPTSTIHGEGAVLEDGKWVEAGEWKDGKYTVELDTGSVRLRVPDGVQYMIDGIDFRLESLGSERFRRTTQFLYAARDGSAGADYAAAYFTKKGAEASVSEDDDHYICTVVCEGTTAELTEELRKLFGSGNSMTYRKRSSTFSLSDKTTFTDCVDLSSILNASNAKRPMHYYISASGAENIVSVIIDGSEKIYTSARESYLTIDGGSGTVEYYGSIPITSHIILYVIFGLVLLGATIVGAYMMIRYRRAGLSPGAQQIADSVGVSEDDDALAALTQTTTFSIAELGALTRNKRFVDEINKDIEERIESDRLDQRKKEIRQKELEEMERKVYGKEEPSPLDEVPELDISVLKAAVAETSDPPVSEPEPDREPDEAPVQPEEPVNPFSLLDDEPDEDDDDV